MSDSIRGGKSGKANETLQIEIKGGESVNKDALKELEALITKWGEQYNVKVELS